MRRPFLIEPLNFALSQSEDTPQNESIDTVRMSLRIGQTEGASPATSEQNPVMYHQQKLLSAKLKLIDIFVPGNIPALEPKFLPNLFHVSDQVPGGVVLQGSTEEKFPHS